MFSSCSKDTELLNKGSSSAQSLGSMLYPNMLLLGKQMDWCDFKALNVLTNHPVTLYNHAHKSLLTTESKIGGTWKYAQLFLDRKYTGLIWKKAQVWVFELSYARQPKFGGWPFSISNKVGGGKTRYISTYEKPNSPYSRLVMLKDPTAMVSEFEFVMTECKYNGWNPRGLLIDNRTKRLVQVMPNDVNSYPAVVLGDV